MAAVVRCFCSNSCRNFNLIRVNSAFNFLKTDWKNQTGCVDRVSHRGIKKWQVAVMREMKERQKLEEKVIRPRSAFVNFNYSAEIFAFAKRINEELSEETLKVALIHPSYIEREIKQRQELGVAINTTLNLSDNTEFVKLGTTLMNEYIIDTLKEQCPFLPNDGIMSLHDYLTSDDLLAYIAKNLGMSDLILSADFPVKDQTLALSLKSLIGAILNDEGKEKAQKFILDLIITQLIGKEITDIWSIPNPMGTLRNYLQKEGGSEPEPRIIRESGQNTIFAAYIVGLYVDKELIGQGPGETPEIATEMAALDALKRIYKITDSKTPFSFKTKLNMKVIEQKPKLLSEEVKN